MKAFLLPGMLVFLGLGLRGFLFVSPFFFLFSSVYALREDREWTKKTWQSWSRMVLVASPSFRGCACYPPLVPFRFFSSSKIFFSLFLSLLRFSASSCFAPSSLDLHLIGLFPRSVT